MWGDSHARALVEGLRLEVPEVNFIVYAPSACLMVSEVYITARGSASCPDARRLAFDELKKSPAPLFMHHHGWGHVELRSTVAMTVGGSRYPWHDEICTLRRRSGLMLSTNSPDSLCLLLAHCP